jgi:RHS repeat-associated protein
LGGQADAWFDAAGRPVATAGPQHSGWSFNSSSVSYDAAGQVVEEVDGNGAASASTFDLAGHRTEWVDGNGHVTSYSYDDHGRLVGRAATGKPASQVDYHDGDGSASPPVLASMVVTRPDQSVVTSVLDGNGQVVGVTASDGSDPVTYSYDELGRVVASSKGSVVTSRSYDSLGAPTAVTRAGRTVGYQYDPNRPGRLVGLVYPNNEVVTRSYDAAGRWVGVTDWDGKTTSFGYDVEGNITSVTGPNSMSVTRAFDRNGASVSATYEIPALTWPVTYGRGLGGELTSVTQWGSSGSWAFDSDAQVVSSSNPSGTFAYDPGNNPTRLTGRYQTFSASGELCWTGPSSGDCGQPPSGATVYGYDDNGQRVDAGADSFTYDAYGAMSSATPGSSVYAYAADGLRTSKTVNGVTTEFAWDDSVGVPELVQDGGNYYLYGPDGLPVERIGADPTVWLLTNETGSVAASIDTTGQLVATRSYDTWGNVTAHTGDPVSLGWQSQYQDAETGLYYLRHRYYDPATAQFTTPDPLYAITGSRYGYAGNDPVNGSDPTGMCWGPGCWVADHVPGVQGAVNVMGGVVNGITLGHGKAVLNGAGDLAGIQNNGGNVDWSSPGAKSGQVVGFGLDLPLAIGAPEAFGYASMAASGFDIAHCWQAGCSPGEWMMLMIQAGGGGAAGLAGSKTGAVIALLLSQFKLKLGKGSADFDLAAGRSCSASPAG